MTERQQFWPSDDNNFGLGVKLEARSMLAWELINSNVTVVAGDLDGEDGAKRQKLKLQAPPDLVDRCFNIADAFLDKAIARGEAKAPLDLVKRTELTNALEKMRYGNEKADWKSIIYGLAGLVATSEELAEASKPKEPTPA